MKKKKRLKVGDTVKQKMVDRDGNERQVTSRVIGTQDKPAKLADVKPEPAAPAEK